MIYYLYDGSFEGLLTAVYDAYYRPERPDYLVVQGEHLPDLFSQEITIETDQAKAEKVYKSIEEKISPEALNHAFYVYLSDTKGAGTLVYHYLRMGWQVGPTINAHLAHDTVKQVLDISQRVGAERHRMLGLIRFRKLQGELYYAAIEPDHNIVGLVAPHFAKRLADQNWVIHDLKRGIAAVYNQREWIITVLEHTGELPDEDTERNYQQLWKQYYASTSITDRKNSRLQRQYMPVRYWKHLPERE